MQDEKTIDKLYSYKIINNESDEVIETEEETVTSNETKYNTRTKETNNVVGAPT